MGDSALADVALIPRALKHDDPDWWMRTGELAYEANYQLINDNLLDLAHLGYVHENTLGRNSISWAESRPTVTPIPRGLRIARWVVNNPGPRYLTMPGGLSHVDMWTSYDYMVPGIFLLGTRSYPVGMAAARGMQAPDPDAEPLTTTTTSQAITPIDDGHTIYCSAARQRGRFAAAAGVIRTRFRRGQRDDRGATAGHRADAAAPHAVDPCHRAPNRFRRLLDELMADEAREAAANTVPPLGAAG